MSDKTVWLVEYAGAMPVPVYATSIDSTCNAGDAKQFETKEEAESWMFRPSIVSFSPPWTAVEHGFCGPAAPPAPSEQQDRLESIRKERVAANLRGAVSNASVDWLLSRVEKARALAEQWETYVKSQNCSCAECAAILKCVRELLTTLRGDDKP